MTAYWTKPDEASEYDAWVNDLLVNAPEAYDDDADAESIVTRYVHDLEDALRQARDLITFADGAVRSRSGAGLTWLYAADCTWAQRTLAGAGLPIRHDAGDEPFCHPLVPEEERLAGFAAVAARADG